MSAFDHPVLRAVLILLAASGLTSLYVTFGGYFNWPPFYEYPSVGSQPYIIVYIVSLFAIGVVWFLAHRGRREKTLQQIGIQPAR